MFASRLSYHHGSNFLLAIISLLAIGKKHCFATRLSNIDYTDMHVSKEMPANSKNWAVGPQHNVDIKYFVPYFMIHVVIILTVCYI